MNNALCIIALLYITLIAVVAMIYLDGKRVDDLLDLHIKHMQETKI
jgi:hypothetical protein